MTASAATIFPSLSVPQASGSSSSAAPSESGFSFHDLLSVVNPLQHIPVVSTLYRAVTGDTIGPIERIAGDTLYGGVWGFVSSMANVAFQEITGKDFGDTALALLEGDDSTTAVADNAPTAASGEPVTNVASVAPQTAANGPPRQLQADNVASAAAADDAASLALMKSMNGKGVDSELSQRAMTAYRKSLAASAPVSAAETIPTS